MLLDLDSDSERVDASNFDYMSPSFVADPYGQLAQLRKQGPVHFIEKDKSWLVLDYDETVSSLKNREVFSSSPWIPVDTVLLGAEPAEHERARKALRPLFDKAAIKKIEDIIASECDKLLTAQKHKSVFDLNNDISIPITEITMNKFLGLSDETASEMARKLGHRIYNEYEKTVQLQNYFRQFLEIKKNRLENSFYQSLIETPEGQSFSLDEIGAAMKLVFIAGTSSTAMLVNNTVKQILLDASLRSRVINEFDLLPGVIEEVLRLDPPVHTDWRYTLSKTTIAGVQIPQNALVKFSLAAANRDPKKFENSLKFLPDRTPNLHIAFGMGAHSCIGAVLARIETKIVVRKIFEKYPNLNFAESASDLRYMATPFVREFVKFEVSGNQVQTVLPDAAPTRSSKKTFDALDGMRFGFIILIIIDHMDSIFKLPSIPGVNLLGVLVTYFLVLSGFVLTHQYNDFPNFAVFLRYLGARYARLGPLALLGFTMLCCLNPYPTFDAAAVLPSFFANLFLVQSWVPDRNYYLCFNAPAWTLSAEILLYFLLPVCLLAARRKGLAVIGALIFSYLSGYLAFAMSKHNMVWATTMFPPTRILDFLFGIVIYKIFVDRKKPLSFFPSLVLEAGPLLYFVLLLWLVATATSTTSPSTFLYYNFIFIFGRALPAIIFTGLIYALTAGTGPLKKLLSTRLFKVLSPLSAALYFIHFPIRVHFDIISQNLCVSHPFRLYALVFAFILSLSYLACHCVEIPLRFQINLLMDDLCNRYFPGKTVRRWHGEVSQPKSSAKQLPVTILAAIVLSVALGWYIEHSIAVDKSALTQPQP